MKFILISALLATVQPIYQDEKTCMIAADRINAAYPTEGAMCIPLPAETMVSRDRDANLQKFLDVVKQLQTSLDVQKQVDNN